MKFDVSILYPEGYLPTPRCRKLRYRDKKEIVSAEIKEIRKEDMELAFRVETSESDTNVYAYNSCLWKEAGTRDVWGGEESGKTPLEIMRDCYLKCSTYFYKCKDYYTGEKETREDILKRLEENVSSKLIVDGKLYIQTSEPMYCIYTFGLGHNHAGIGTSLSVVWHYNENISHKAYFSALELEKAREQAIKTALGRGDTDSVKYIKNCDTITVYNPKYVTRNPRKDHGDGNPLLNDMETVISGTYSSGEAALLLMGLNSMWRCNK